MMKWFTGFLDRCCALAGVVLCSQIPVFITQYTQQLVGRAAEIKLQVDAMRQSAGFSGKTLEQLIQKFLGSPDLDITRQGELMLSTVQRNEALTQALTDLHNSSVWSRPFEFLFHLDRGVFDSTFREFQWGLPLNLEGGIYALVGMGVGYLFFSIIIRFFTFFGSRVKAHELWNGLD